MSASEKRPRRAQEILDAINSQTDWVDRNTIADLTGKRKLSPNDVHHLTALADEGVIEINELLAGGRTFYKYRKKT